MFTIITIPTIAWILFGVGFFIAIVFLVLGPMRYRQLASAVQSQEEKSDSEQEPETQKISVVAFSSGHEEEVAEFLTALSEQEYSNYEAVIVVDGASREASNLQETFGEIYPWASFSFVPPEALNLSRRKLANTIGIKKATGEIILTTLTNVKIPSSQWLSKMATPFENPDVEIVLGAAFMDMTAIKGMKRYFRGFDSLLTAASWMLYAIDGKPYRGDGANLAFRRDLFFRNSGYGNNYYLHSGDDDIFVSQVATAFNSRCMFAPQATIRVEWGESTSRQWVIQKDRYNFASRYLDTASLHRRGLLSICNWVATLSLIAALILPLPENLLMPIASLVVMILYQIMQIVLYRLLARIFAESPLCLSVPIFYLLRPVAGFLFRLRYHRRASMNFTWRR